MIEITCNKCKETKSEKEFYFDKKRDAYKGHCKDCHIGYVLDSRRYNKKLCTLDGCANKHYALGYCRKHYERKGSKFNIVGIYGGKTDHPRNLRKYGITLEDYQEMSKNGCQICGKSEFLVIDHDHACCNEVPYCGDCTRGVVCSSCNINISKYEQDIMHKTNPLKDKVIKYLENYQVRRKRLDNIKVWHDIIVDPNNKRKEW
jgi:hypothetical protein